MAIMYHSTDNSSSVIPVAVLHHSMRRHASRGTNLNFELYIASRFHPLIAEISLREIL